MKPYLFCFIAIILLFSSCIKEPEFSSFTIEISFDFEKNWDFDYELPAEIKQNIPVALNNLQKTYIVDGFTDSTGNVSFNRIEPGFYRVTLAGSFINDLEVEVHENGRGDYDVFSSVTDTIPVYYSTSNPFVIKEYYYSGCLTEAGKSYSADQFVEIYNNSDEVQYVDGLSLVEHESYDIEPYYFSFLEDTIVVRMIWTIPGEGADYPVEPGSSVVLARDAFDHKSDPLGNPLCPVDLGHAEFEFFVYTASGDDIDGAYSTNLIEDLFTFRGNDISFHTRGGSAIALVQIPGSDEERKEFIANNLILKDDLTSTRFYGKIPVSFVIDAVEVVWDEAHAVYKRLPIELDAGYTYNPEGSRSGLGLRRKIQNVIDGRVIYKDTNNSTEDFEKAVVPNPWIYE